MVTSVPSTSMSSLASFFPKTVKRCALRHGTNGTTTSTSTSSSTELKDEGPPDPDTGSARDRGGISRIFFDAVQFGAVLAEDDDTASGSSVPSTPSSNTQKEDDVVSVRRFAELVGRDLSKPDLAASERLAKLSVNTWATGSSEFGGIVTNEPESIVVDATVPLGVAGPSQEKEKEQSIAQSEVTRVNDVVSEGGDTMTCVFGASASGAADLTFDTSKIPPVKSYTNLPPEEIVKLLVEEFGPLVTSEDDEEKLLAEVDAGYFQEVAILVRHSLSPPLHTPLSSRAIDTDASRRLLFFVCFRVQYT